MCPKNLWNCTKKITKKNIGFVSPKNNSTRVYLIIFPLKFFFGFHKIFWSEREIIYRYFLAPGPGKLKKSRTKKLAKSNKSISRKKKFFEHTHLLPFQKWAKINFWTGKKFKTARNAISLERKNLIYLISRVFMHGLFEIFWPAVKCKM